MVATSDAPNLDASSSRAKMLPRVLRRTRSSEAVGCRTEDTSRVQGTLPIKGDATCQEDIVSLTPFMAPAAKAFHNQRPQAIGATGFPQLEATGYCSHRLATTTRLQVISDTGFPCGHMQHSESDG